MEMVPFPILGVLNTWQNPQSQFAKNELRETAKVPYSATGTRKDWDGGCVPGAGPP